MQLQHDDFVVTAYVLVMLNIPIDTTASQTTLHKIRMWFSKPQSYKFGSELTRM